jgi:SAM-dependent methyltransferase
MKTPREKPHWQGRHRHVSRGRMAWYGEPGDERYWYNYWKARLTPDYYASAETLSLRDDELGRILLKYMPVHGLHLEAGCGAGYWVAALCSRGMQIEGIEYARELVEMVHAANPQLPVRWGNALAIDRPGDYYDSYLSIGVVEHRVEGPEPFLAEAYRVLKSGGRIIITVPFYGPLRRLKSFLARFMATARVVATLAVAMNLASKLTPPHVPICPSSSMASAKPNFSACCAKPGFTWNMPGRYTRIACCKRNCRAITCWLRARI